MRAAVLESLQRKDVLTLVFVSLLLFAGFLLPRRSLNIHETVHCENTREMLSDGDWVIPHYGGRPWLERAPLPFWITAAFVRVLGEADWVFRLPVMLLGLGVVLLTAWMASVFYGRWVGLLAGVILATMREFLSYATGAEADMFLCAVVTGVLALFVRIEFGPLSGDARRRFLGSRPLLVAAFFVVLGMTNLTKGLAFGTVLSLLPVLGFLLVRARTSVQRYLWGWGWLLFLAVALPWPILVWLRLPDVIAFWKSEYIWRAVSEPPGPWWYYGRELPWMIFPWTLLPFLGLWATRPTGDHSASPFRKRGTLAPPTGRTAESGRRGTLASPSGTDSEGRANTFLWCWAILPFLFLSLSRHKHHHYLLSALAPWSILAAVGLQRFWQNCFQRSVQWRGAQVFGILVAFICAGHLLARVYEARYLDKYEHDRAFVEEVCRTIPDGEALLINGDDGALVGSWWLHYTRGRATLLHNLSFLRDERLPLDEVYLITRRRFESDLEQYGKPVLVHQSQHSRGERTPGDRFALYRLRYHTELQRLPGNVAFTPLQATGRDIGPILE